MYIIFVGRLEKLGKRTAQKVLQKCHGGNDKRYDS